MHRLLDVKEVAHILGVSAASVYQLVKHEELRAIRMGRNGKLFRFRAEDIEEAMKRWSVERETAVNAEPGTTADDRHVADDDQEEEAPPLEQPALTH